MHNIFSLRGLSTHGVSRGITYIENVMRRDILSKHPRRRWGLLFQTCHRYYSNKAAAKGCQTVDIDDVVKEVSLANDEPSVKHASRVKVLLIQKSLALKSLMSNEGPVVHDAHAGAVVDVRTDARVMRNVQDCKKDIEIKLQVEQLMKDAKSTIEKTPSLEPYEDLEYVEDTNDRHKVKTELVGALSPNALDWRSQKIDVGKLGSYYASLSKSRLTGLVVLTAMAGYAMAPCPLDPWAFLFCSVGTGLTSSSANSINQFFEVPYDSQMDRTKNRILVRGLVTPLHAISYAAACGAMGVGMLYFGVNTYAASLGALNLLLYTSVYTPMKRTSIVNTWTGAVVGAIPPLIGWVGCSGELEVGAWIMAAVLYSWQFPHFNALSWNLRADYSRAGYRMMSVTDPGLCQRVALRHSVGMIGICSLAPLLDVTTWTFAVDSLPFNGYLVYLAWRFYQNGDSKSSRKLFMFSLIHLPAIMMLMIISKKHYKKNESTDIVEKDLVVNQMSSKMDNSLLLSSVR